MQPSRTIPHWITHCNKPVFLYCWVSRPHVKFVIFLYREITMQFFSTKKYASTLSITCINLHIHIYVPICVCIHIYVYMFVYTYICIHTYTHIYIQTHTYVYVCIYMYYMYVSMSEINETINGNNPWVITHLLTILDDTHTHDTFFNIKEKFKSLSTFFQCHIAGLWGARPFCRSSHPSTWTGCHRGPEQAEDGILKSNQTLLAT